jgi:hypothetical protein
MESPPNRCSQLMTPTVVCKCACGGRLPAALSGELSRCVGNRVKINQKDLLGFLIGAAAN